DSSLIDARLQRLAFDQFHHDAMRAAGFEAVDVRDVRVVQGCQHFCFALKATDSVLVKGELIRQDLDCDFTLQLQIASPVHLAHATLSEQGSYFKRAKLRADCESHDFAG